VKVLAIGLVLTLVVTSALVATWGREALLPGVVMGVLATSLQWEATRRLRRDFLGATPEFLRAMGAGMVLRLLGVLLMLGAIVADRERFPPLPTALGFLGVVIPLLYMEVRLVR